MKSLTQFLAEAREFWTNKYLSQKDAMKAAKAALKSIKSTADKVMSDIPLANCEDPDDAFARYDSGAFSLYAEFEDAFAAEVEKMNKNAAENIGDIKDTLWWSAYDLLMAVK